MKKQIFFSTLANLVPVGFSWLILLYLIHFGTKHDIGVWGLIQAIALPIHLFFTFKLRVVQLVDHKYECSDSGYFYARILLAIMSFLFTILYSLFFMDDKYIYCMLALGFSYSLAIVREFYISKYQIQYRNKIFFIVNGLTSIFSFMAFVLVYIIFSSIYFAVIAFSLSKSLCLFFDYFFYDESKYLCFENSSKKDIIYLLKTGFPLGITISLTALLFSIPQIMVEKKLGIEMLGVFVSVSALFSIFSLMFNSVFQVFLPSLSKKDKSEQNSELKNIFLFIVFFLLILDFLFFCFFDLVYLVLLKDTMFLYREELMLCLIASNMLVLFSFGNFLTNLVKDYKTQPYLYSFLLLIVTIFNFLFLNNLKLSGVFISLIIANFIGFCVSFYIYKKKVSL